MPPVLGNASSDPGGSLVTLNVGPISPCEGVGTVAPADSNEAVNVVTTSTGGPLPKGSCQLGVGTDKVPVDTLTEALGARVCARFRETSELILSS